MLFFLGTDMVHWVHKVQFPLFLNRLQLAERVTIPQAICATAIDSGAFTELSREGRFTFTAQSYVDLVRRYREKNTLAWATIMDWMCEPFITAKTGKTIREHQQRTLDSFFSLTALATEINWIPVLQGFHYDDYFDHARQYEAAGVDLRKLYPVGLGSICRRQGTYEAEEIIHGLWKAGYHLHAFGMKLTGLIRVARYLTSADSMAWSFNARKNPPLPGHTHQHCSSCLEWAVRWRDKAIRQIEQGMKRKREPRLF